MGKGELYIYRVINVCTAIVVKILLVSGAGHSNTLYTKTYSNLLVYRTCKVSAIYSPIYT